MLKCVISGDRYYSGLSKEQVEDLKLALRLENPEYTSLQRYSRGPEWLVEKQLANVTRLLSFWDEPQTGVYQVPRGYIIEGAKTVNNVHAPKVKFPKLQIAPRDWQKEAIKVFDNIGPDVFDTTIQAPPGNGKTVFGILTMAKLGVRTLIMVHKDNIKDAWIKDLKLAFGEDFEPTIIKGKLKTLGPLVTVAMVQTLRNVPAEEYSNVGLVIVDECHHCPSSTYLDMLCNTESKYRLGLTATPKRSDGLNELIPWACGPIRYVAGKDTANTVPLKVHPVFTGIQVSDVHNLPYTKLIAAQSSDEERLDKITSLASWAYNKWSQPILIVTLRVEHSKKLKERLAAKGVSAAVIHAHTKEDARTKIYADIRAGKVPVTIATSSMLSEGVNIPIWTHLIMANSFNDETLVRQVIGRVERAHKIKTCGYIWDLVDRDQFARAMFSNRTNNVYAKTGGLSEAVKILDNGKVVRRTTTKKKRKHTILRKP